MTIERTTTIKGSIESILGISETDLKSLVEQRVKVYMDAEELTGGNLSRRCKDVIPTLGRDPAEKDSKYNSLQFWINIMEEGFLPISYDSIARGTISSLKRECENGVSGERKIQLENCMKILTGPVYVS